MSPRGETVEGKVRSTDSSERAALAAKERGRGEGGPSPRQVSGDNLNEVINGLVN